MNKLLYTQRLLFSKFGFNLKYLIFPLYRVFYAFFKLIGIVIDDTIFRSYKKKKIEKPIFLIGHPRSGTTFLHKFILKNTDELEGMFLWRMIIQSIFWRTIIKPFLPLINKFFPENLYDARIHKTGFLEPETDDVAYFFRRFSGMFYWLYFSALEKYNSQAVLEKELINQCKLDDVINNLDLLYKKNVFKSNNRIFSKSFSLILDIKKIKSKFPDAKIIILIRDPLEVIPSSLSLARSVQMNLNSFNNLNTKEKNNYYRNLYNASIVFYKLLFNQLYNGLDENKDYMIVNYKDLIHDFRNTMHNISDYSEFKSKQKLEIAVENQIANQKNYTSKHKYSLHEFGISEYEVQQDFDFVYKKFSF